MSAIPSAAIVLIAMSCPLFAQSQSGLVVHEWGTFTSFAGSDGVQLEFRPLTASDLPDFVYDRARQAGHTDRVAAANQKGSISATQRMETPVTYFYTDREREIDVRVGFPQGLLTEFYPPVREMGPAFVPGQPEPVTESSLNWGRIRLIPDTGQTTRACRTLPESGEGTHYGHARQTDSALVRVDVPGGEHYEKFLFYRGVGNFNLPVILNAAGDDRFTLESGLGDPGISGFLVNVEAGRLRFVPLSGIVGVREIRLPEQASSLDAMSTAMVDALTAARLYPKEAEAMVKTWKSSWFSEEGTRLLYLLPTPVTNRILPLDIRPAPDAMVRVMVGRLEILTPERQTRIERDLALLAGVTITGRAAEVPDRLGRFAEPALSHIQATTRNASVRRMAETLLDWQQARQRRVSTASATQQ